MQHFEPMHFTTLRSFPVTYKYRNNNEWYQETRPHIEVSRSPHSALRPRDGHVMKTTPQMWHSASRNKFYAPLPSRISAVNWSPPFQAPFLVKNGRGSFETLPGESIGLRAKDAVERRETTEFRNYFHAIKAFKKLIEADDAVLELKLDPGTAVVFDNRRIVHARRAFENKGGERWLRGAYLDNDVFRSRLRVLQEQHHETSTSPVPKMSP
ncbi:MAG: hypothetical protein Q9183_000590 [Haloplaca sp. 2 TL-2023]